MEELGGREGVSLDEQCQFHYNFERSLSLLLDYLLKASLQQLNNKTEFRDLVSHFLEKN